MTADIAHELRTPISVILGHAEGIHDGVIPASPETLEIIREESIRLEHLVNDLRMLALSDAGELELKPNSHAPAELIDQAFEHFTYQAQARGITLNRNVAADLPEILVDTDRMSQVLCNLMENAIRNTPAGGEIILGASIADEKMKLNLLLVIPGTVLQKTTSKRCLTACTGPISPVKGIKVELAWDWPSQK